MRLAGIIYLFETSTAADPRDREIFRKLCGDDALSSVVIGTRTTTLNHGTGDAKQHPWDTFSLPGDAFWEGNSNIGPAIHRRQNAWEVVNQLAQGGITSTVLQIQRELVEFGRLIPDTEVGKFVYLST
jgi:hypothetical protein